MLTFLKKLNQLAKRFFQRKAEDSLQTNKKYVQISSEKKQIVKKHVGQLLTQSQINIPNKQLKSLIEKRVIIKLRAIKKRLFIYECQRCGNKDQTLFADMPCLTCHKPSVYCRKCIQMGRVMKCDFLYYFPDHYQLWPQFNKLCTWKGNLTTYQLEGANKLVHHLKTRKHILVWAVTGSGKTEMIFPVITKALQLGQRVCIATPRKDVVQELYPRCKQAFKHLQIDALYGGSEATGTAQFIITTTHQLIRYKQAFDLMIIDEIDAFPYHKDRSLPFVTERSLKKCGVKIYLTATPRQAQKRAIVLNKLNSLFIPFRYHGNPLPIPQLAYSFNLTKYLNKDKLPPIFNQWLTKREKRERQLLLFVPTVNLTKRLLPSITSILKQQQIINDPTMITSVHANDHDRHEKIKQFRKQKIKVLVTTTILERGVTFPSIDVIVFQACHNVFDEAALIQIAGRAGRSKDDPTGDVVFIHEGKTNAIINAQQTMINMNHHAQKIKGEM